MISVTSRAMIVIILLLTGSEGSGINPKSPKASHPEWSVVCGESIRMEWTISDHEYGVTENFYFRHNDEIFAEYSPENFQFNLLVDFYGRLTFERPRVNILALSLDPVMIQDGGQFECGYKIGIERIQWSFPVKVFVKRNWREIAKVVIPVCLIIIIIVIIVPIGVFTRKKWMKIFHKQNAEGNPKTADQSLDYSDIDDSMMTCDTVVRVGPTLPQRDNTYNQPFEFTRRISTEKSKLSLELEDSGEQSLEDSVDSDAKRDSKRYFKFKGPSFGRISSSQHKVIVTAETQKYSRSAMMNKMSRQDHEGALANRQFLGHTLPNENMAKYGSEETDMLKETPQRRPVRQFVTLYENSRLQLPAKSLNELKNTKCGRNTVKSRETLVSNVCSTSQIAEARIDETPGDDTQQSGNEYLTPVTAKLQSSDN